MKSLTEQHLREMLLDTYRLALHHAKQRVVDGGSKHTRVQQAKEIQEKIDKLINNC